MEKLFEEYQKNIKNCLGVIKCGKGIKPVRFTDKQFKNYEIKYGQGRKLRSSCLAGIKFEIYTNSEFINIEYQIIEKVRDWVYFDIFVNDVLVETLGESPIVKNENTIKFEVPRTDKELNKLTVYFPHLVEITIQNISFSENAIVKSVAQMDKSILCIGDSITQGMDSHHPSSTYAVLLSRFLNTNLLNQGVGGQSFDVDTLDNALPYKPDIITVAYGTNDWSDSQSIETFKKRCNDYMDKLMELYFEKPIFIITPTWRADINEDKLCGTFFELIDAIRDVCLNRPNVKVLDGIKLIPNIKSFFGDEFIHPTDEGFLHMSLNIAREIKSCLS